MWRAGTPIGPLDGRYRAVRARPADPTCWIYDTHRRELVKDRSGRTAYFDPEGVLRERNRLEEKHLDNEGTKDTKDGGDAFDLPATLDRQKNPRAPAKPEASVTPKPKATAPAKPQQAAAGDAPAGPEDPTMKRTKKHDVVGTARKAAAKKPAKKAAAKKPAAAAPKKAVTPKATEESRFKFNPALKKEFKGNQADYVKFVKGLGVFTKVQFMARIKTVIKDLKRGNLKPDDKSAQMVFSFLRREILVKVS